MKKQKFNSVWDAIENSTSASASMKARSKIMIALQEKIKALGLTQTEVAKKLGITQPRLSDLTRGHIDKFSLDALFDLAEKAGLKARIVFGRAA